MELSQQYLIEHTLYIPYAKEELEVKNNQAGIPQGNIIRPELYFLYMADRFNDEHTILIISAEDTAILLTNNNPKVVQKNQLQATVTKIAN